MNIRQALWEHLITKRKYNKLQIKLDVLREELEKKTVEINTERRIHNKQKEIWENAFDDQENTIVDLKKQIKQLKSKKKIEK